MQVEAAGLCTPGSDLPLELRAHRSPQMQAPSSPSIVSMFAVALVVLALAAAVPRECLAAAAAAAAVGVPATADELLAPQGV
jgi:hypothetical protein